MRPISAMLAPSETRNAGRMAWIISDEMSMNMDTKPSAQTLRGTARHPDREDIGWPGAG
jgi:hypothetical protein